jgi:hypothetical protein
LIISRLEANILRSVIGYSSGNIKVILFSFFCCFIFIKKHLSKHFKDTMLKQNILKSIDLITKCMHQDHLQKDFNFSYKPQILNQIIVIH